MSYLSYAKLNALEEFSLIAGTEFKLTFEMFEEDGTTPAEIGGATIKWLLCPYGQPEYNILELDGLLTTSNSFEVSIGSQDTQELSGKYIQQPVLIDFSGQEFRPAQGVVTILPRIPLL